jgi:hypothetical protein
MALSGGAVLLRSQVKGGRATVKFTATGNVGVIQANSTVNSDLSNSNDAITGASISGISWSLSGNTTQALVGATIARGATTIMTLSGTGQWSAAQGWLGDGSNAASNVAVTFNGGQTGVVYAEFSKIYAGGGGDISE